MRKVKASKQAPGVKLRKVELACEPKKG